MQLEWEVSLVLQEQSKVKSKYLNNLYTILLLLLKIKKKRLIKIH